MVLQREGLLQDDVTLNDVTWRDDDYMCRKYNWLQTVGKVPTPQHVCGDYRTAT